MGGGEGASVRQAPPHGFTAGKGASASCVLSCTAANATATAHWMDAGALN